MQWNKVLPLFCMPVALCAPAVADEIVYFTNGTSMTVESHETEEGVIRLNLGDQAFVAFPVEQIDKIETADGTSHDAAEIRANRIVPGSRNSAPVPARHQRQWQGSSRRQPGREESGVERDSNGVAVYRPYANSPQVGKRQLTTLARPGGNPSGGAADGGIVGTFPMGTRSTLPSPGATPRQPIVPILRQRDNPAPPSNRSDDSEDE